MKVFRAFVKKSLLQNRSRTLVTVIGIILSIALLAAVIEGAYSGVMFLRRAEEEREGKYQGIFYQMNADEVKSLANDPEIEETALWQEVGWAGIESENEYKPYLLVESIDGDFTDFVSVHLISGAMPQNESELLLPIHLKENGGKAYEIGDEITLALGRRTSGGYELSIHEAYYPEAAEEIAEPVEKTYIVCGYYKRFSSMIEPYISPGYVALTSGGGTGSYGVFFTVRHPGSYYSYIAGSPYAERSVPHSDLLNCYGSLRNNRLARVLYSFAAILIFLIAFGSVSLIYNSFSISVSERTKQFGILKSVGATKKQIRFCVFWEAILLSAVALPAGLLLGCAGIAATLCLLRDDFAGFLYGDSGVSIKLILSPWALLIAAAISLLVTLVSAYVPARRAMRISPIDSLRQSSDLKTTPRSLKTSKLSLRLFGFEGMIAAKNFKRNRKRYRSVTVSLFLSVVLFISASSFCSYLSDLVGGVTSQESGADLVFLGNGAEGDPDSILQLLSTAKGVTTSEYQVFFGGQAFFPTSALTEESLALYGETKKTELEFAVTFSFLDDASFKNLLKKYGLSESYYFDPESPRALFVNENTVVVSAPGEDASWKDVKVLKSSEFPLSVDAFEIKEIEDYYFSGNVNSEGFAMYYDQAYMNEYYGSETSRPLDESRALLIPIEEAFIRSSILLGAEIEHETILLPRSNSSAALIYPYSMAKSVALSVLKNEEDKGTISSIENGVEYAFQVKNHQEAAAEMKKLLEAANLPQENLHDLNDSKEAQRMLMRVIRVFSYGFIILISLIAASNVFNTISTSVSLRRREFAMLRSIGMHERGFYKMMSLECVIYGTKSLVWGLPAAFFITYLIYSAVGIAYTETFYIPIGSVLIAMSSVFLVVFASMLYALSKIRRDNPIDALKTETL